MVFTLHNDIFEKKSIMKKIELTDFFLNYKL